MKIQSLYEYIFDFQTQKALAVLIQNNLIKFAQSVYKQSIEFSAEIPNIYRLLRFPK